MARHLDAHDIDNPSPRTLCHCWAVDPDAVNLAAFTSSHDDASSEIFEIAVMTMTGELLFDSRIRTTEPIHPAIRARHGLEEADLARDPSWSDIAEHLAAALNHKTVFIYDGKRIPLAINRTAASNACPPPKPTTWAYANRVYATVLAERDAALRPPPPSGLRRWTPAARHARRARNWLRAPELHDAIVDEGVPAAWRAPRHWAACRAWWLTNLVRTIAGFSPVPAPRTTLSGTVPSGVVAFPSDDGEPW